MITGGNPEDLTPLVGLQDLADGLEARIALGERGRALFEGFRAATRAPGEVDVFIDTIHDVLVVRRDASFVPTDRIAAQVGRFMIEYRDRLAGPYALRMAERYPASPGLNALAAQVTLKRKELEKGREYALASLKYGYWPGAPLLALTAANALSRRTELRDMLEELESGSPSCRLEVAAFLWWSERYAEAIGVARGLSDEAPDTVEGSLLCGDAEYGRKNYLGAAGHFARVLRHAPRHFKAAPTYSHCLWHLRDWGEAEDFLSTFVRSAPAAGIAGVSFAMVSFRRGRIVRGCRALGVVGKATAVLGERARALACALQATELDLAE